MRFPPAAWSRLVTSVRLRGKPAAEIPQTPPPAPIRYPAAFCAPGTEAIAAITLWLNAEEIADIRSSRMLEGSANVIVVSEPPELLWDREAFRIVPHDDADPGTLGYRLQEEMRLRMMTPPRALSLSSIISPM